jgi:hypothetical protein
MSLYLFHSKAGQHWNNPLEIMEDEAVNTLRARVAEDGWSSRRSPATSYWTKNSEPW